MAKKKLSTEEILAAARAQAADKPGDAPSEKPSETSSETSPGKSPPKSAEKTAQSQPSADESSLPEKPKPSADKPAPKPKAATPKSTKDILAAARAQSGGTAAPNETSKPSAKKPAAPSGEKPASTEDILARARAQATGGEKAQAEKPITGKPAAAKPSRAGAPPKPAGERPSVQEMLKAVREGTPAQLSAAEQAAARPVLPPKPQKPPAAAGKPARAPEPTRRNVLLAILLAPLALFSSAFATAWTMFSLSTGAFVLGMARFMMPNVLVSLPSKFKVGPPSDYPLGMVENKWKSQFQVWIVHVIYGGKSVIYALSTVCTHLGCTPNWLEGEQKFKCPCHGSGFYKTGINFEGPAPRPLERYAIRLAEDGMIEVDKSVKFQQEMGQWDDPTSYVELA